MSFVEEVRVTQGRFDVMNAFKPYVTNRVVDITAKGKDPKSVPNRTNYLFCTNFEDALPLKDGDRRFAAFKTKWQVRADLKEWETGEGEGYYKKLYSDMREDAESIKWGLLEVDIPQWFMDLAVAPETRGTKDMIHASKSQSQRDIEALINEYELSDKVIRLDVLKSYADEDGIELPKTGALTRAFEDAGYPYRKRLKIDGALVMVYMKNDYDNENIRALLD